MCLQIPPRIADFLKSATRHFAQLPTCACRFPPPVADFLKSATGQFAKLPTCACRFPPIADFLKSATGQFAKLPTWACRFPLALQIFSNLLLDTLLCYLHVLADPPPSCRFSEFCHWTLCSVTYMCLQIPPPSCRFFEICQWTVCSVTYMCLQIPPPLQIFWILPLDSLLSYLHVLADPPPVADFLKSATGQFDKLPTCACRFPPPSCRFSEICHWTVC